MVKFIEETEKFIQIYNKLDNFIRKKIKKQIEKIIQNPETGKPMRYARKGTRELYIKPFRLSYAYMKSEDKIIILNLYHKKRQ